MHAGIMTQRNQRIVELFLDPHAGALIDDILAWIDHDMDMDNMHALQIRRALNRRRRPLQVLFANNNVVVDSNNIPEEAPLPAPGPLRRQSAVYGEEVSGPPGQGTRDDPIDLS